MKTTIFKIVLLIAFCVFNLNSHAQTKEETISWLNEKLDKYLVGRIESTKMVEININECEIILIFIESNDPREMRLTLPTKDVTILEDGFGTKDELLEFKNVLGNKSFITFANCFHIQIVEKDIKERIEKALAHLATFCPKKKETF